MTSHLKHFRNNIKLIPFFKMPKRKHELTQKPLTKRVKRLLDGLLPRTSTPKQRAPSQRVALVTIDDDDDDDERTESSNGTVPSSSALKRHEDVMKTIGKTISPPPTLAHHQQSATTTQPSVILLNVSVLFSRNCIDIVAVFEK